MRLNKKKAELLEKIIAEWEQEGIITPEKAQKLRESYTTIAFDWKQLAQYSFWIAVICFIIAIGALAADKMLMKVISSFIEQIFYAGDQIKALVFLIIASMLYYWAWHRSKTHPHFLYSNEIYYLIGVFATIISTIFFYKSLAFDTSYLESILMASTIVYAFIGLLCNSKMVWTFSLLALGGWFGAETGYHPDWQAYFLGMNYPLRFVFFGLILFMAGKSFKRLERLRGFYNITYVIGLWYLFIALWMLSIFGNYGSLTDWYAVEQKQLLGWAGLMALFSVGAIIYGLKFDDATTRIFGITFLIINLYTRYVEYLWDALHTAAFFSILALSFWVIGQRAEQIWHLGSRESKVGGGK